MVKHARIPLISLDAGWLFLLPGLCLLGSTVLIPAYNDLMDARWVRDRNAAIEKSRLERLDRYGMYLDAIEREDESVVMSLAVSQLNMIAESFEPVAPSKDPTNIPASIFPMLEPEPGYDAVAMPARLKSRLEIWSTNDRTRLWLIVGGGFCVLVGLLPAATRQKAAAPAGAARPRVEVEPVNAPPRAPRRRRAAGVAPSESRVAAPTPAPGTVEHEIVTGEQSKVPTASAKAGAAGEEPTLFSDAARGELPVVELKPVRVEAPSEHRDDQAS